VGEHLAEIKEEALGGVLGASPEGGGEQFVGRGGEVDQVLQVSTAVTVHGGMEFEEDLIEATDVADGETRAVFPSGESGGESDRKAATEQGVVGDLGVEPAFGEAELSAHILGGDEEPRRQGARGDDVVSVNLAEDVHVLGYGASHQTEREQGGTAADDKVVLWMVTQLHQLSEERECLME